MLQLIVVLLQAQTLVANPAQRGGPSRAVSVEFHAEGGAISSAGLYRAGTSVGQYRIIATVQGTPFADTAVVSLVQASSLDWRDVAAACGLLPLVGVKCEKPRIERSEEPLAESMPLRPRIGFDESLLRLEEYEGREIVPVPQELLPESMPLRPRIGFDELLLRLRESEGREIVPVPRVTSPSLPHVGAAVAVVILTMLLGIGAWPKGAHRHQSLPGAGRHDRLTHRDTSAKGLSNRKALKSLDANAGSRTRTPCGTGS
jgi:hypothetical protein